MMIKFINGMLTGKDNQTPDIVRFGMFSGIFTVILIVIIEAIKGHEVDLIQFATSISIICGIGSVGLYIKQGTEPKSPTSPPNIETK